MGLFDIFKKHTNQNPPQKCCECFRPIKGHVRQLNNKPYCQECYNRKMAIVQQTAGQAAEEYDFEMTIEDTAPKSNMFVCDVCGKELPIKYRHSGSVCAECHATKTTPKSKSTEDDDKTENIPEVEYLDDITFIRDMKDIEEASETVSGDVSADNSFSLLLKQELIDIVQILRRHGCDIVACDSEIKMAYDKSWFSEYRIICKDGIYLYREVAMGGYNLEKRLDCTDMSASFLIICADLLTGMKYRKMINTDDPDYHVVCEIMRSNKNYVLNFVSDLTNFLVIRFIDLIKDCSDSNHYFTDLKHFTDGSECRCKKCGLVVKFNRGSPERIESKEMDEFLKKYKGSTFDFYYPR